MKTKSRRTPQPTHKAEPKKKRSTKSHQEEIAKTHAEEYPLQPSVPGVVGAGHACELFGPGACDTQLPVNEVIEEYTFGQFIRLRHTSPDGETRPVTGVVPKANDRNFLFTAGAGHLERAVSILALLAGKPEPLPSSQSTIQLQRVEIDDLDRLLVHRSIGKGKDKAVVSLDPDKVRRLLAGVPVETLARREQRDIRVLLVPASTSTATKPAVRQFAVADLAAFILRPEVPGVGGASYPVVLDATTIKQLRTDGVARVGTGETQVTLTIESGGASSSFLAGMDRDSTPITIGATKAQASMGMAKPIVIEPLPFLNIVSGFIPPAPPLSLDDFTLGLYLPWTQSWRLKGYSRGALLHSLTLAPQEETTIEVFTWDRRKRSLDQSSSFDSEQSIENSGTTKDMVDVIRELGSSSDFKIEGYGKVNMQSPWVQAEAGFKVEDISKLNDTSKHTLNHLVESTQKASARVRVNRQTKISESSETGSEERVTRKVRNPNMCRTLTLDYFEVLAHYIVTTAFAKDDAQICFFVPFPVALARKCFGEEDLRIHERALRGALINPELAGGFEAARTAWARNWAMDHVCDAPHCAHSEVSGSGEIKEGANAPSRALLETATQRVISICRELYYARVDDFCWYVMKHTKVFGSFDGKPGSSETRQVKLWAYVKLLERRNATIRATLIKLGSAGLFGSVYDANSPTHISQVQIAPPIPLEEQIVMLETLVAGQQLIDLQQSTLLTTGSNVNELAQPFLEDMYALIIPVKPEETSGHWGNDYRDEIWHYAWGMNCLAPDDGGIVAALENFKKELGAYKKAQEPPLSDDAVNLRAAQNQAMLDADADQVRSAFPLSDSAATAERVESLLAHLNYHRSHYCYALLQAMPIGEQMQELTMVGIPTDLVEPRILGMVNGGLTGVDLLAVPINTALDPRWKQVRDKFIDDNAALVKLSASRETRMPTPGASIEARLGACDACEEFIMESRVIELDQRRAQVRAQRASARITELEGDRAEARVKKGDLDDPTPEPGGLHVTIDKPPVTP